MKRLTGIVVITMLLLTTKPGSAGDADIVINEIMYNPAQAQGTDDAFEFIELYNGGLDTVDVAGWRFTDAGNDTDTVVGWGGGTTEIPPGGYAVITDADSEVDVPATAVHLSTGDNAIATYGLSNNGEHIALFSDTGAIIDSLTYNDTVAWGDSARGYGSSLECIDPSEDNALASNWAASTPASAYGTPGRRNSRVEITAPAVITSLTTANPSNTTIDLSWVNPGDSDFTGTLVVRKQGSIPTGTPTHGEPYGQGDNMEDGTVIYNGSGSSFTDTGLAEGTTYYYRAFAFDEVRNYSSGSSNIHDTTLPVTLISFTALAGDTGVILRWTTGSEIHNKGFNIYRAERDTTGGYRSDQPDAGEYIKINPELIPGAGTSTTSNEYSFTDLNVRPGAIYFYKLEDISLDGRKELHGPIVITIEPGRQGWGENGGKFPDHFWLGQNFPNPSNPQTTIQFGVPFSNNGGAILLEVFNLIGQKVKTLYDGEVQPGYYQVIWDNRDQDGRRVAAGTYLYMLKTGDFMIAKRMMVIR